MSSPYRVGLVVPSSNTTIETEIATLLRATQTSRPTEGFTFHSARVRMRHVTPEGLRAMNDQTDRAAAELADLRPDVVATACLVAIMAQGKGHHRVVEDQIQATLAEHDVFAPVVSSAGALLDALHAIGAQRIAIVTPYVRSLTDLVVEYLADASIEVHDAVSLEVSDNRAVAALDPARLPDHVRRLDLTGCDALVLSACVQMPSLPVIAQVERACGLPTLTAATATTWAVLHAVGVPAVVPGAGALLAEDRPLARARA
jgi:maleate isomerase